MATMVARGGRLTQRTAVPTQAAGTAPEINVRVPARLDDVAFPPISAAMAAIQPETMRFSPSRFLHSGHRSVLNPVTSIEEPRCQR
jgi:hypothetical protein